uniref:BMERB domain-containing protein n=1 Tax=Ursus americanus TaxID=9643 RepID=A0A452SLI0_URSAM
MGKKDDPKLMQEWFKLVQEKNAMVRYESELMIFARELELEDRQSRLQQELRERMAVEAQGIRVGRAFPPEGWGPQGEGLFWVNHPTMALAPVPGRCREQPQDPAKFSYGKILGRNIKKRQVFCKAVPEVEGYGRCADCRG